MRKIQGDGDYIHLHSLHFHLDSATRSKIKSVSMRSAQTFQSGADPEIFVRGGPTFRKLRQAKKKKKKKRGGQKTEEKTEGCGGSSPSADVIDFPDNYLYIQAFFGRAWSFVQLQAPLYTSTKMT